MKKKSRISRLLGYIYIPVVFCIIGYLILGIALKPVWEMAYDVFGLLSADDAPNFNPELKSIYDPEKAADNPITIYVEEPEEEQIISYEYISAETIEAPDETEEEARQEHYLYIEYADANGTLAGGGTDAVTGEDTDAAAGEAEDSDTPERQLAYIYAADEEVEDLSEARRIAFAYVEEDEQGRKAAYIYLTEEDAEDVSEDTAYDYKGYLDELGLEDLEPGQQIVYLDEPSADDVDAADDATDEADPADVTDPAKQSRNIYIISTGDPAQNRLEEGEYGEKEIRYKRIDFQKIIENLTSAREYIHINDIDFPLSGTHYAQLVCDRIKLDTPVYWNDTSDILRFGAGQYLGSYLPGFGRMIVLSAHNNSFFAPLKDIKKNDTIEYHTHYGNYKYRVVDIQILNEEVLQDYIYDHILDEEEVLLMYTCYPFEAMAGRKTDRLTIFAERIEGYDVKWRDLDE